MGTIYVDTGGSATNSGTSDNNTAKISGASGATGVSVSGTTVTFPALTDLSTVVTAAGATQDAIYIADATNTNQKIFWITAVAGSGGATPTATVSVAPTGTIATSQWAVGGRFVWTPASIEIALRPLDVVIINNSIASTSANVITGRVNGVSTTGRIYVKGKSGVRPVITNTSTNKCIERVTCNLWWFENLELAQQGASGDVVGTMAESMVFYNIKVSDGGAAGFNCLDEGCMLVGSEVTNTVSGFGVTGQTSRGQILFGNYIHDVTGDGIINTSANTSYNVYERNILDTCGGRGFLDNGAPSNFSQNIHFSGNTVYGCGNSGFEVGDVDRQFSMFNNIFMNNGDASGEYNVEFTAGTLINGETTGFHAWNVFNTASAGGSGNLLGITDNSQVSGSEFTTDPVFTNAASGDFSIGSSGSAYKAGYPGVFLGGSTGYLSIGAVDPNPSGGGGGAILSRAMTGM